MTVQTVPVESLEPHPANPRIGNVELIRESIRANGFYGTVIVQASTSRICAGAHRWRAAQLEGMTEIPADVLDVDDATALRIVAATLGLHYQGVDLRQEQVDANREQREALDLPGEAMRLAGDAADGLPAGPFDFIFSCPPYFDLEQYSEDPRDLSNAADFDRFLAVYRLIVAEAALRLAPDRFACFVVGEIRDKDGALRSFVPETIAAFELAGMTYYNEAILVTAVGSLAIRAARIFNGGRKLAKGHQNVLVFLKGSAERAAEALGDLELPDPAELFGEVVTL